MTADSFSLTTGESTDQELLEQQHRKQRLLFVSIIVVFFSLLLIPRNGVTLPQVIVITLGLVGSFTLFLISMRRVDLIVILMIGYIPFSKLLVGDFGGLVVGLNAFNILFLLIVWGLINQQQRESGHFYTTMDLPLLAYCVLTCISLVKGGHYLGQDFVVILFTNLKRWLSPILLYYLIINTIQERTLRKDIIITICITVFLGGLLGLKEFYVDIGGKTATWETCRINGISNHPNQLGAFFDYYTPLLISFFIMNVSRVRYWALIVPILVCVRALMLTVSRGAMIAFGTSLLVFFMLRSKFMLLLALLLVLVFAMFPKYMPETVADRFTTMVKDYDVVDEGGFEKRLEGSARMRMYALEGGLKMIADHPWFGVGYDVFPFIIHQYMPVIPESGMDTHNTYLSVATEMGLPALVIFLVILFMICKHTYYVYKNTPDAFMRAAAQGFLAGMAGLLVGNLFGSRLSAQEVSTFIWVLAAIFMRESRELRMEKREQQGRPEPDAETTGLLTNDNSMAVRKDR